ncbi:uncharacterized protein BO97DRAFT_458909 [Aspergillus homomorphus CBS 101889]|uniref:Uncharacterized protein n=1 Tax=Aspergillus homomorphus (strain CBS 101889) TaxID=1450537 RepID=A0A395I7K0_ASPHC|nr:hypothetical protein BO97DRAFT_458909 [Aspergillus homomorphus CBS 101889]RAL15915.1 hypothetical protein BO97DRAFT_458909 [Aspergillus homomorphus CBS 101889]
MSARHFPPELAEESDTHPSQFEEEYLAVTGLVELPPVSRHEEDTLPTLAGHGSSDAFEDEFSAQMQEEELHPGPMLPDYDPFPIAAESQFTLPAPGEEGFGRMLAEQSLSFIAPEDQFTIPAPAEGSLGPMLDERDLSSPYRVITLLQQIFTREEGYSYIHMRKTADFSYDVIHAWQATSGPFFCLLTEPGPQFNWCWYTYVQLIAQELETIERWASPDTPICGIVWIDGQFRIYEWRRVGGVPVARPGGALQHEGVIEFNNAEHWGFLVNFLLRLKGGLNFYRDYYSISEADIQGNRQN